MIKKLRALFRRNFAGCRVCHSPVKGRRRLFCSPACEERYDDLTTW